MEYNPATADVIKSWDGCLHNYDVWYWKMSGVSYMIRLMFEALQSLSIFSGLDSRHLEVLKPKFEYYTCPPGTVVFEQGEPADYLYLILHGQMAIRYKPYDGPPMILTHLRGGDAFGWSSVIGNPAYTTTLISKGRLEAIRIKGSELRKICINYPETGTIVLDKLAHIVSRRWKDAHTQVRMILDAGYEKNGNYSAKLKV